MAQVTVANLNIRTMYQIIDDGDTATIRALLSENRNITDFRLGHGGERPLYEAVRMRKPDIVAVLLEFGADLSQPAGPRRELGTYRSSLMSWAAMAGPRMTAMLLEQGLPIARTGALHSAASVNDLETMRLLLQHGADVNETIGGDRTPMHFAAWKGRADVMKWLEDNGARIDAKDSDGKTPAQLLEDFNMQFGKI